MNRISHLAILLLSAISISALTPTSAFAQETTITVSSTTSTEQSGLFGCLLPQVQKATGISVKVVALGTGQALDVGRRGDADVVFVHDQVAEEKFIAEGAGVERIAVMYNDFVLVGPSDDPAKAAGKDIVAGLKAVYASKAPFVSRGDKSGMGPALNTAAAMNAYILADRGTWLSFKNRQNLKIIVEGDSKLFNQYGVILVNPKKHAHVKADAGQKFINWLVSAEGQATIAGYKIGGEQLFFPNAVKR
jgi:tungstate transport system substrate-binding protein